MWQCRDKDNKTKTTVKYRNKHVNYYKEKWPMSTSEEEKATAERP